MATFNGKSFSQLTNLNVTDELRIHGNLFSDTSVRVVKQASDLSGTLDSSVMYFLDGVIDMGNQSIEVPQGGLNLGGHTFDISGLTSSETNYTMFTSPVGGSGNVLGMNYHIDVNGASSQVYNITGNTGFEAFEFVRVNYNNCTSLGTIANYRQGLEEGTGRFGGTPSLTLAGTWVGGYRITTSIVRSIDDTMSDALFAAGAGFTMASRFLTDINCDLGALAPFCDFAPSNLVNPSLLQIHGAIFTRNGASDPTDTTIFPNILVSDLESDFKENQGLSNTFVGGRSTITSETTTTIGSDGVFVDLAGTYTPDELEHFDSPANGQLRHLGHNPHEYRLFGDLTVAGGANDEVAVKIVKWDNSASGFVDVATQTRQINALTGGRNVAFFSLVYNFNLDQNDYVKLQVANNTDTTDVTAEEDSFYTLSER